MLKPGIATKALNEFMIRNAQCGRLRVVATSLAKGADVNYDNGALLLTAIYMGKFKIFKLALRAGATVGLKEALLLAESLGHAKMVQELNDYVAKKGLLLI